jgi:hypothetical protein
MFALSLEAANLPGQVLVLGLQLSGLLSAQLKFLRQPLDLLRLSQQHAPHP